MAVLSHVLALAFSPSWTFHFHNEQLTIAEYSAYHLQSVIQHLDGLTLARTTKLTTASKDHTEDELIEAASGTPRAVET